MKLIIFGFLGTISIPDIYLSLVIFHQKLIPTPLIIGIYAYRLGVPLPTVLELVSLLIVFEVLREAGTRMPSYIGQALSIVGALVVGLSGITSLMIPSIMLYHFNLQSLY